MGSSPPRIGFWGNFGTWNWGNECTLQAAVANVRLHLPAAELVCFCSDPADVEERHGIRAFPIGRAERRRRKSEGPGASAPPRLPARLLGPFRDWLDALRLVRRADLLLMTGTGMLADEGEGPFGLPYDMFRWAIAARLLGRRVAFASVGVEAIEHPLSRFFIRASLRLAHYRSYRDEQSRERLRRMGLAVERDPIYPDLAFSLPAELSAGRPSLPGRGAVAVGLYDYRGRGQGGSADADAYRRYLDQVATFVQWLLGRGREVRVVIGDLSYDEPVAADLRASLEARGVELRDRYRDDLARSPAEVLQQLAGADLVVASRFHGILLSLFLGKPALSVSYDRKNDALMAEMGLGRYCQSIEELDGRRLVEQFLDLESRAGELGPALAERAKDYRARLEEQYRLLLGAGR